MFNKKLIVMVGLPASGKSTWVKNNHPKAKVVSTDNYVEYFASRDNITYDAAFPKVIKAATKYMNLDAELFLTDDGGYAEVVWDQTNLSKKKRAHIISMGKRYGYDIICLNFTVSEELHRNRLSSRVGKTVPAHIISSMKKSYQEPTTDEGFSSVYHIHTK